MIVIIVKSVVWYSRVLADRSSSTQNSCKLPSLGDLSAKVADGGRTSQKVYKVIFETDLSAIYLMG